VTTFSLARQRSIAAAEALEHEKIVPRAPEATPEEIERWVRSRHAMSVIGGENGLREAIEGYATELGIVLTWSGE
jgi:hypothetical protein